MNLKTAITGQYIHRADASVKIDFGTYGMRSVRDVFKPLDKDLMHLTKATTIKFQRLRGLELYNQLQKYVSGIREQFKDFDETHRFTKILFRTLDSLQNKLDEINERYLLVDKAWAIFSEICSVLGSEKYSANIQKHFLNNLFGDLWSISRAQGCPRSSPDEISSRLPSKTMPEWECLGQMVRLYPSYERGLFSYTSFPEVIKTNNSLETGFGKLSVSFRGQLRKTNTSLQYVYSAEEKI